MAQQIQKESNSGTLLQCWNPKCEGKTWRYRGKMKTYAVCPDCRRSIRIDTHQIQDDVNLTTKVG